MPAVDSLGHDRTPSTQRTGAWSSGTAGEAELRHRHRRRVLMKSSARRSEEALGRLGARRGGSCSAAGYGLHAARRCSTRSLPTRSSRSPSSPPRSSTGAAGRSARSPRTRSTTRGSASRSPMSPSPSPQPKRSTTRSCSISTRGRTGRPSRASTRSSGTPRSVGRDVRCDRGPARHLGGDEYPGFCGASPAGFEVAPPARAGRAHHVISVGRFPAEVGWAGGPHLSLAAWRVR